MKQIYFRDDDVAELSANVKNFNEIAIRHNIPINYAVIPGKITDRAIAFLNKQIEKHPHLVSVSQHGYMHENHGSFPKYEFGKSRSLEQQFRDIKKGKEIMDSNFNHTHIFVAPFNAFDQNTIPCLKKLGFKGISAGPIQECQLNFWPTQICINEYHPLKNLR